MVLRGGAAKQTNFPETVPPFNLEANHARSVFPRRALQQSRYRRLSKGFAAKASAHHGHRAIAKKIGGKIVGKVRDEAIDRTLSRSQRLRMISDP